MKLLAGHVALSSTLRYEHGSQKLACQEAQKVSIETFSEASAMLGVRQVDRFALLFEGGDTTFQVTQAEPSRWRIGS